ncbi:glycosyltransferase family 1 protein [Vibrio mimicus]|uniref:DUF1972 domain-containing protein n=1 Tax=Vibrio mimicus TaxID=674 RepID=UPI0011D41DC6|nr:DUF1972 domain-containing protein [Vibrio mimicus]TXZ07030.1 glycosyltransferase family 1 protein [Vibrio mimicus]BCN22643.1 hypothetical protein [Vibrio mimicus]BCN22727.1 hypothetical protein [Vibrio mimicus]
MKKVAIVGTVGIPACYGGFESLVENLTKYKSNNIDYTVFCSSGSYKEKLESHNGARLIYIPINANGVQSIPYDIFSLLKALFLKPDVILILGVSGCIFLPFIRFFSNSKIVTNIDGLEWKREKWSTLAKRFLKFSEMVAVKFSHVVVTDNKGIGDYVFDEYGIETTTIAYGGDHAFTGRKTLTSQEKYALALCRIEPENNVKMILDAYAISGRYLKFIGNWDSSEYGKLLKKEFSSYSNIDIIDPIYDVSRLEEIRAGCTIYLHGHSAGGTNPSLVEMMHFSVPILAFDCNFNRYTTNNKALYFSSSSHLNEVILSASDETFSDISTNMKSLADSLYVWSEISSRYESLY